MDGGVLGMRLVVTAPDCEAALAFYRDVLGMRELGVFSSALSPHRVRRPRQGPATCAPGPVG